MMATSAQELDALIGRLQEAIDYDQTLSAEDIRLLLNAVMTYKTPTGAAISDVITSCIATTRNAMINTVSTDRRYLRESMCLSS